MPRFRTPLKSWQSLVLVLAVAATVVVRINREFPSSGEPKPRRPSDQSGPKAEKSRSSERRAASGRWQRLDHCEPVAGPDNDGDSFVLRHQGTEYTFRLYFADCPEKRRHQHNGDRIAEQGRYFGGLTEAATIALGESARDFTAEFLRRGPVTVETRMEHVFDSERRYAFVSAGGQDLAEALVSRGLARIFTKGVSRPGRPESEAAARLRSLEADARSQRAGGWARP